MLKPNPRNLNSRLGRQTGDTIIEVLIAIAVAAFAIGTSYSLANRSIEQAISARERNEALNIIDSQIADLKTRFKTDTAAFSANFSVDSRGTIGRWMDFCLKDNPAATSGSNWLPQLNPGITDETTASNLNVPPYNIECKVAGSSTDFFVDIAASITAQSQPAIVKTVYKVTVRWDRIGGGQTNQASVYYRF